MLRPNSDFAGVDESGRRRKRAREGCGSVDRHQKARHGCRDGEGEGEQMSRWICWVLQKGHIELDIEVSAGWVRLALLAEAAGRRFRQHKGMDEDRLRAFLNDMDWVGRFQITDDGYLQKVPRCHRHRVSDRGGDPWIDRKSLEIDAMIVCEYCHSTFPPESLPFPSCWYCADSPAFHHGWCCQQNATPIDERLFDPSKSEASSHDKDHSQKRSALAGYAGRRFASFSSGDVVTVNGIVGEHNQEPASQECSSADSGAEASENEKQPAVSDDDEEADQRRRLKRLSCLQQFVTSEISKENAILEKKRERLNA